jgi:hypothetical protein
MQSSYAVNAIRHAGPATSVVMADYAQEKKIFLVIASRYWHNAAKSWMDGAD